MASMERLLARRRWLGGVDGFFLTSYWSIGQFGISFGVSTTRLVVWVRLLICFQFLDDVIIQFITHCVQTLLQQDVAAHFLSISTQQIRIALSDPTLPRI